MGEGGGDVEEEEENLPGYSRVYFQHETLQQDLQPVTRLHVGNDMKNIKTEIP